jgi:hypothetical protein
VLEGAGHAAEIDDPVGVVAEELVELVGRPDVVQAFFAFGVGVERGGEPALGGAELGE